MNQRIDIFLREAAWNFLIEQNIRALPVNSRSIAARLGCRLFTYQEFSTRIKRPVEYLIEQYDNDGFVFWSKRDQQFIICYNDELPESVIRWTIMHEIAHIVLKHVTPEAPALTRIRKIEHPIFEKEADGFTRRVLCPSIVLHNCKTVEVEDIMRLCGISKQAAQHRSDYMKVLESRNKWRTDPLECAIEKQFMVFVLRYWKDRTMYEFAAEIAA